MPWRIGARAFFTSQLGKYLPGSVWPVLVQMEAGKARGASRRTMLAANLITVVLSCAVGLILAAALLPISDTHALSHYWWLLLVLPFLIALLHPRALPMVLDRVFALLHRPPLDERLPVRNTVRAAGWSVGSFIFQGLHIAILALTLGGGGFSTVLLCIGGMSLAVSAGVLFIPAPAGAGVRDVILTLVLRATLSGGQALAVVVASRALLIVADLALAAIAATTLKTPGLARLAAAGSDDQVADQGEHRNLETDHEQQQRRGRDVPVVADQVGDQLDEAEAHDPQRERHQDLERVEVHDHPQHLKDVAVGVTERVELADPGALRVIDRQVVDRVLVGQERHRDGGHAAEPGRQQAQVRQ